MLGIPAPWILVGITCAASALGSLMIYADVVWNFFTHHHFSILDSEFFLGAALSLSTGTLLITAINALLPKSLLYIQEGAPDLDPKVTNAIVVLMFVLGGACCHLFNFIVLRFTADSVVACPHDLEASPRRASKDRASLTYEHAPLLNGGIINHGATDCVGHCVAAPSSQACNPEAVDTAAEPEDDTHSHIHLYHHHHQHTTESVEQPFHAHSRKDTDENANLLSIGLQTTVGIAIHRVPEGLLLFATSQTDRQLGISLVLALSFHSFSEGFSIAAPLYTALASRAKVILIALILGCGPQALGAYIGSLLFTDSSSFTDVSHVNFGLCMAATSGFMMVLSLQMVGTAFTCMSQRTAMNCVFLGCVLSLTTRSI